MQHQSEEKNSESMGIPKLADSVGQGMLLSNATWEHLFDASPDFVFLISTDFRILQINKALKDFFGSREKQILGSYCYEVFHQSQKPVPDCPVLKLNGSSAVHSATMEGTIFGRADVKAIALHDAEGKPAGFIQIIKPEQPVILHEEIPSEAWSIMLEAVPDPAIICDPNGRILSASGSFAEMCGINEPSSINQNSFVTFLTHDEIEKGLIGFHSLVSGDKESYSGKLLVRRTSREALVAEVSMKPVRKASQIIAVLVSFRDITGQLDLQESAGRNQIRLARFNNTFLGFSPAPEINLNRMVVLLGEMLGASFSSFFRMVNGQAESLTSWNSPFLTDFDPGITSQMVLQKLNNQQPDYILVSKPDVMAHYSEYPALEHSGIKSLLGLPVMSDNQVSGLLVLGFTYHYQLRSDDRDFCRMVVSAIALENIRIGAASAGNNNDINYRELFDFFTDAIYILSEDGSFVDVNLGASLLYGCSREDLIGKSFIDLSAEHRNNTDDLSAAIANAFQGESQELEWWGTRQNGEIFPNDIVLNKGRYFGKDVVIAIGRDISERKHVEDKLLNYNLELKETNQSKDKFFSILAHDLKNPFGGLLGFIDLLYEDIDELTTDQVKEYLQNIRTASYHTYSLLENLLEWSRIQTGKVQFRPSRFDLREEIESVVQVLEANAVRKNIKLLNLVPAGVEAEADRNMIHSVIQNLTANAIKFSNSNSSVTISGKYTAVPGTRSLDNDESNSKPRKWYEISVTDTGIGIPEEIRPKLFKLDGQFSMAGTANEPGTGLGLILCKEMVEKNGGQIRVESASGNGSTFAFTLPLSD